MPESSAAPTLGGSAILKMGRLLVNRLNVLLKTTKLYDVSNVNVQDAARALGESIRTIHAMEGTLQLARAYDYLTLNDTRLKTDIAGFSTFRAVVNGLAEREIGALEFADDASLEDLIQLAREYHRVKVGGEDPFGEFEEGLRRAGVKTIRAEEAMDFSKAEMNESLQENLRKRSVKVFFRSIEIARRILGAADPAKLNFRKAKRVVHDMVDLMAEDESYLVSLTVIKNYDDYTFNHSANVSIYCIAFGQKLGLPKHVLADLGMAALFHDIGKTRIPKEVLNKPGKLTEEEWGLMKNHSVFGAETLLRSRQLTDSVIRNVLVAFEHHLNLDLGGYPEISDRRELNLFSKMVAIADTFDALTTPRVYRSVKYSPQEAMSIMMEGRGTLFDPILLKIFVNAIGVYPIGTLVELDTGAMGVVFRTSETPGADPLVKLFSDSAGNRTGDRVVDLSLRDPKGKPIHTIARTVDPADYFDSIEDYLEIL